MSVKTKNTFTEKMAAELIDDLQAHFPVKGIERGEIKIGFAGMFMGGTIPMLKTIVLPKDFLTDDNHARAAVIHEYSHLLREYNIPMSPRQKIFLRLNRMSHDGKFRRIEEKILAHYGLSVKWGIIYERNLYLNGKRIRMKSNPWYSLFAVIGISLGIFSGLFQYFTEGWSEVTESISTIAVEMGVISIFGFILLTILTTMNVVKIKDGGTVADAFAKMSIEDAKQQLMLRSRSKICAISNVGYEIAVLFGFLTLIMNLFHIVPLGENNDILTLLVVVLLGSSYIAHSYGKAKVEHPIRIAGG